MFTELERTLQRNLLKHAVGQHITCRGCGGILDAATVVVISNGAKSTRPLSVTLCAECWGAPPMETAGPVEVLDGRVLFPGKRPSTFWRLK